MVRRVVITGIGAVTPLGLNVETSWNNLTNGNSGIRNITRFDASNLPCTIAGELNDFDPTLAIDPKDVRKMDLFIQYGLVAAKEAIEDSGLLESNFDRDQAGTLIGSGIGGLATIEYTAKDFHADGKRVSPFFIPASLINLLPGHLSIKYGLEGPNLSIATACSTGAHAIGEASRIIESGDADIMVAGGAEAPITHLGVAGFSAARTLATNFNDDPTSASRPWDKDHAGFVMGEGAGIVVLEEYEHAKKRGAKIYAELIGYGLTGDAYHMTAPSGIGAYKSMERAVKKAKIDPSKINYINAHGTSTQVGDVIELENVQKLFAGNKDVKMSSTKSAIGHLLGAAGSVETIFTALAIRDQIAPPTLNLNNPLDEVKINLVPHNSQETKIDYALSNSFGFGGTNASLILKKV